MPYLLYHATNINASTKISEQISQLISLSTELGNPLTPISVIEKMGQKWLKNAENGNLVIDANGELYLLANGMKVSPNWQSLQQRVVKAGKKTELLLKVAKLNPEMQVIDATAGFGHDSLILASTGAKISMIEQNPMMFLLLYHEQQKMQQNPNWQKLLSRITLYFGNTIQILPKLPKADVIYLDPMFPQDSYKSAVSKTMQVLHNIVLPPTLTQENLLLDTAQQHLLPSGRVIVKRPNSAPYLSNLSPNDSISNESIRFDSYLNTVS